MRFEAINFLTLLKSGDLESVLESPWQLGSHIVWRSDNKDMEHSRVDMVRNNFQLCRCTHISMFLVSTQPVYSNCRIWLKDECCIMYKMHTHNVLTNHNTQHVIMYSTATLRGHSMAVTSVDWKLIGQQSIIATCADDRVRKSTVYVWSNRTKKCRQCGSHAERLLSWSEFSTQETFTDGTHWLTWPSREHRAPPCSCAPHKTATLSCGKASQGRDWHEERFTLDPSRD